MQLFDMAEESATYSGGVFTLGGAVAGRQSFGNAGMSGGSTYYRAATEDNAQWEVGIGSLSGSDLTRTFIAARATGFDGEFTGPVTVAGVVSSRGMPVIDRGAQSAADGVSAMAEAGGTATGDYAYASGYQALATHEAARAVGVKAATFSPYSERFFSGFRWAGENDTSGLETVEIKPGGGWGGALALPEYGAIVLRCQVVAIRDADSACYSCEITACVRNIGGTTSVVGTPVTTEVGKTSGVTVSAALGVGVSGAVAVNVTGSTGDDWRWAAMMTGAAAGV